MSFFEIEPMGAGMRKMRGGVAMGGVSLGGVSLGGMRHRGGVAMGGVMMGGAMTKEELKAHQKEMKKRIADRAKLLMKDVFVDEEGREYSLGKNEAKGKAKDEIQAENKLALKKAPKVRVEKEPKETKKALRGRLMTLKKRQEGEIQHFRNELAPKGLTQEKLRDIATQLAVYGVGLYDMESGCGFFGDLWEGVKNVGKTALQVAPHLLPMML